MAGIQQQGNNVVASLYLIVPVAIVFCAVAVAAWLWASRSGQFDDLDREARRILHDEPARPAKGDSAPAGEETGRGR
jgi:cbb3-type cytochrome oxidase maturation protein